MIPAGYLGAGIATLVNLFNPERIVLGGWAGLLLGPQLLPEITASADAHALHRPFSQTSIELLMDVNMSRQLRDGVALAQFTAT